MSGDLGSEGWIFASASLIRDCTFVASTCDKEPSSAKLPITETHMRHTHAKN